jgi:hypothetical protein
MAIHIQNTCQKTPPPPPPFLPLGVGWWEEDGGGGEEGGRGGKRGEGGAEGRKGMGEECDLSPPISSAHVHHMRVKNPHFLGIFRGGGAGSVQEYY